MVNVGLWFSPRKQPTALHEIARKRKPDMPTMTKKDYPPAIAALFVDDVDRPTWHDALDALMIAALFVMIVFVLAAVPR